MAQIVLMAILLLDFPNSVGLGPELTFWRDGNGGQKEEEEDCT